MSSTVIPNQIQLSLKLFTSFLKIGPTTFGGGYAILHVIDKEFTEHRKWLSSQEMTEITALSGAAPGGIGVNVAALIGYRIAGIPGLLCSIFGISMPTTLIMLMLCATASGLSDNPLIQAALMGIKPTIVALIAYAAVRMGKQTLKHPLPWSITVTCILLLLCFPIHPLLILGIGTMIGLVVEAASNSSKHNIRDQQEQGKHHMM